MDTDKDGIILTVRTKYAHMATLTIIDLEVKLKEKWLCDRPRLQGWINPTHNSFFTI